MKVSNVTIDLATNNDLRHIFDQKLSRETSAYCVGIKYMSNSHKVYLPFHINFFADVFFFLCFFFFFLIAFRSYQLAQRVEFEPW